MQMMKSVQFSYTIMECYPVPTCIGRAVAKEQEGNGPLDSRTKVMISDKKFGNLVSVLLWPPVVLDGLTIVLYFKALFTSDFKFELSGPNNPTFRTQL